MLCQVLYRPSREQEWTEQHEKIKHVSQKEDWVEEGRSDGDNSDVSHVSWDRVDDPSPS